MPTVRLVYYSECAIDVSRRPLLAGLREILSASKRNNQAAGVTGALIFDNRWFLQALEGERSKVWGTIERIEDDERHTGVVVVDTREIEQRLFGNWWMGVATRNEQTAAVFAPHLRHGFLHPPSMNADDILGLMRSLCSIGLARKLAA